ncbi:MAG: hypothetical protein L0G25_03755, partial [Psychrobacter sp.]|nr:hypothetical protein [Psychrobacter sp.]
MSQGDIEGAANIYIDGSEVFGCTGFSMTDVTAPSTHLNIRTFGPGSKPWSYVRLNDPTFKDIDMELIRGFSVTGLSCDNLKLANGLYNGSCFGAIISGNITTDSTANTSRKLSFISNIVGGT